MRVPRFGPPEVFERHEGPDPVPAAGEVGVAVEAAGINFADVLARMGLYADAGKPPITPGYEFAGRVTECGDGVDGLAPGDAVLGFRGFGCYADRLVADARSVIPRPDSMDAVTAAAWPVTYLTAHHSLIRMGNLQKGERILIHGAGGGVGTAAVQIARRVGAVVFGSSSVAKHEFLASLGVDHIIDYRDPKWPEEVRRISGDLGPEPGMEMIFDPIGGRTTRTNYELLAHTGRLINYGVATLARGKRRRLLHAAISVLRWPRIPTLRMMQKNRGVAGVHIGHLWHRPDVVRPQLQDLLGLITAGELSPIVDRTFPLEEAAQAHHYLQDRLNRGKVVLTVDEGPAA